MEYSEFLRRKSQIDNNSGFEPIWMPDFLFDFQRYLVDWAIRKGRGAIFAECGLGKTPMQLVWAQNVIEQTNRPVMIATPIAVGQQTVREAEKFGIKAVRTRDGKFNGGAVVWVTNYEQLHKYNPLDFAGFVGDESSAIKDATSERKAVVTEFTREIPYRLLCTATAAPNDFWELGTSSEVLGHLGFRDMITMFFRQETSKDYLGWGRTKYRFRGHAEEPFWKWVCSWARSIRKPSDLGFDDSRFVLPELIEETIVVKTATPRPGMLFPMAAQDMREERAERRHSLKERCDKALEIVSVHEGPSVIWCELNPEGDLLEKIIPGAVQVKGTMSDSKKEEILSAFTNGEVEKLVIKPKIGAWGLNWQHCSDVVVFPSHSFEQYYQLVRRCYRFGQKNKVKVSSVICEGEEGITANLARKKSQAETMFANLVEHMLDSMAIDRKDIYPLREEIPQWA